MSRDCPAFGFSHLKHIKKRQKINGKLFLSPYSILAEAKNLSFNATAAFKAYSNIKANVDAAEKEAKAAKQRASEALALVSGHDY